MINSYDFLPNEEIEQEIGCTDICLDTGKEWGEEEYEEPDIYGSIPQDDTSW